MAQPTEFQRALEQLRTNITNSVSGAYNGLVNAGATVDEMVDTLAPLLLRGSIEGENMGRAELARMVARIEGISIDDALPDIDGPASNTIEAKRKALRTVLDDAQPGRQSTRLLNLLRSDSTEAAQHALSLSMRASNRVAGWVRVLEDGHCELCFWLYREGYIYPPDRPLTTHPGCLCSARPVTPSEMVAEAQRRYGGSRTRHSQRQLTLWNQRAEMGAQGGSSPAAWRQPPEDGNRTDELTGSTELP